MENNQQGLSVNPPIAISGIKMGQQMVYRPLSALKKLPNNPRAIRDKQFKTLCDSIRSNPDYFEARPLILSDRTGELVIIAGNQRYEAAKYIGLDEVPTYLMPGLSEQREREIVIRDNVNNGEWNIDDIANFWSDLPLKEWGVEISWVDAHNQMEQKENRQDSGTKIIMHECPECGHRFTV